MKRILLLIVGLVAGLSMQARAATPGVYDAAGFFSADAVTQANQVISDIKQSTKHDLMIETYSSIPADMQSAYDPAKKNDFFEKWLVSRARATQVRGVFVLICKDPSRIQLDVGSETRAKAFTIANRDELRNILVTQFKAKNFDQGLLDGVNYVQSTMQANVGNSSAQNSTTNGGAVSQYPANQYPTNTGPTGPAPTPTSSHSFGILSVIIVIGFIFFIVRAFLRPRNSYGAYGSGYGNMTPPVPPGNYGGYGYPPQSGGFGRGLLGGLLGGALGGYLYDRTTHRDQSVGGFPSGGGGFPESPTQSDQGDFNSSMFDSGNQGAGGDFGGGGDAGGGGGDSGGGSGGDF